ncbi:hypothetical protein M8994_22305, partial [Brucella sp. 21LCYQ03]|nr:hypothetical protein [Brucella sp. 21LCYQ03]
KAASSRGHEAISTTKTFVIQRLPQRHTSASQGRDLKNPIRLTEWDSFRFRLVSFGAALAVTRVP